MKKAPRVLSVQSTVVHGYVGNKAANFPMQLFGLDVSPINTVQLSNHTGYDIAKGQKLSNDDFNTLMQGLKANNLMNFSVVVSGYIGSVSFLRRFVEVVGEIKENQPSLFFSCDPVMGDNGKFYTPTEFAGLYKQLLPYASLITPNQFEAEQLSDLSIKSLVDAGKACKYFHEIGVPYALITSMKIESEENKVYAVYSILSEPEYYYSIEFPVIDYYVSGTGDLTTALITGWLQKNYNFHQAVQNTMSSVQTIINETISAESKEILLIENQHVLLNPIIEIEVTRHSMPSMEGEKGTN